MKFPIYKQLDAMDCGPTCLRMISKFYGKSYSLEYLRSRSYITNKGVSLLGISDAAETIGFRTKGYRLNWEELRDEVPLPCIVHWKQRHFVVVYGIKKKRPFFRKRTEIKDDTLILVADPAAGLLTYKKSDFLKHWLSMKNDSKEEGAVLLLEPTPQFYNSEDEG